MILNRFFSRTLAGVLMCAVGWGTVCEAALAGAADTLNKEDHALMENWKDIPVGLQGLVGSIDLRYGRQEAPALENAVTQWRGTAWRGERICAQVVLFSSDAISQVRLSAAPLKSADAPQESMGEGSAQAFFVGYTAAEGVPYADILDTADRVDIPARSVQPVWVEFNIPRDAVAGVYQTQLIAQASGGQSLAFDFEVEVLPLVLPPAEQWAFHLDLWQNPYAIARWHRVEPWSEAHFALMEPYYRMLADAGQKCLTVSLLHKPWGGQTYDPFEAMIQWRRTADGDWEYDFSIFDAYVAFGERCGLGGLINCYSMIPWGNQFRFLDLATGDFVTIKAEPGTVEYEAHWRPFLRAFEIHCREKGLLGRVAIAMDERPDELMAKVIHMVNEVAPSFKIASATNREPAEFKIHDWSVAIGFDIPADALSRRVQDPDLATTFYVCCGPERPNTFTFSPLPESAWLGHYAAAQGLSGVLRWAYCSWTPDPFVETKYEAQGWPSGDCFLVYPGPRSSMRFERLREGIQDYEKIRILREKAGDAGTGAAKATVAELDKALAGVTFQAAQNAPAGQFVKRTKTAIDALSRAVSN